MGRCWGNCLYFALKCHKLSFLWPSFKCNLSQMGEIKSAQTWLALRWLLSHDLYSFFHSQTPKRGTQHHWNCPKIWPAQKAVGKTFIQCFWRYFHSLSSYLALVWSKKITSGGYQNCRVCLSATVYLFNCCISWVCNNDQIDEVAKVS
jgi:hypothetical protein